jgi:hypothetical protein
MPNRVGNRFTSRLHHVGGLERGDARILLDVEPYVLDPALVSLVGEPSERLGDLPVTERLRPKSHDEVSDVPDRRVEVVDGAIDARECLVPIVIDQIWDVFQ